MKSSQQKMSRALAAGVGVTLTLGLVFWAYNLGRTQGAASRPQERSAAIPAVAIAPPTSAPVKSPAPEGAGLAGASVLQTPTSVPAAPLLAAVDANKIATTRTSANSAELASAVAGGKAGAIADVKIASGSPLMDAKSKMDSGKLLDARHTLNAAVTSGTLSEADLKNAKELLTRINATVIFSSQRFEDPGSVETITVPPRGALSRIAISNEVTADLLMRINNIKDPTKLQAGKSLKVVKGPFSALVNKTTFTLELWQGSPGEKGSMYITSYPVGLGKDDSTPSGVWAVSSRLKNPAYYSPRGEGVIAADDPKNPLGEYWIGLAGTDGHAVGKTSYGIHGTIDPTSIGKQESMGCIRLKNEDIERVYEAVVEGKSIVVVKE